jgi:transposase
VDEKSQIQALDHTQPGLPFKKSRCGTMTHDYKRHGTATLFAALNAADGTVISMCDERHRHQEWLQFLRVIDSIIPPDKQLHLIADNYATHKHRKIQRWLQARPVWHRQSSVLSGETGNDGWRVPMGKAIGLYEWV